MSEYTPTEARARDLYSWAYAWRTEDAEGETDLSELRASQRAEFDRMIAKVKAEAQVEALRDAADALAGAEPNHLGDATEGLEFFDYGTAAEYGIDVAAAYLRNVANETAREAGIATEGNKTGEESSDD